MNIVLVYNPHSGNARSRSELNTICTEAGIKVTDFVAIEDGYEETLKSRISKDQIIAVVGGDGTLSSVAQLLVDTPAILAPLPGGTLNHFTKDLGIPQELEQALQSLPNAPIRSVDIATVNDIVFVNNSSIGLYPSSLQTREELEHKKVAKWVAMVIASARAFAKYRTYTVTIGDETFATPFLFVGNNNYHVTDDTPGRTNLGEGILSVYSVAATSRWALFKVLVGAIVGKLTMTPEFKHWTATHITIHTKRSRVHVSRDGELETLTTPLSYAIKPKSLRIVGNIDL